MNKFSVQSWVIEKNGKEYRLELPAGADAGDAYAATYEFHKGIVEEINRITESMKPAEPAVETPVEVVN